MLGLYYNVALEDTSKGLKGLEETFPDICKIFHNSFYILIASEISTTQPSCFTALKLFMIKLFEVLII